MVVLDANPNQGYSGFALWKQGYIADSRNATYYASGFSSIPHTVSILFQPLEGVYIADLVDFQKSTCPRFSLYLFSSEPFNTIFPIIGVTVGVHDGLVI